MWPPGRPQYNNAAGPLEVGGDGRFIIPDPIAGLEEAQAAYAQLLSTSHVRELTRREKLALRSLRRYPGVRTPSAPHEFTAIAKARLKRLSRAAKRARAAQRTIEGARAAQERLAKMAGGPGAA